MKRPGELCRQSCLKDYRSRCLCAVSFGLGMSLSCLCPPGLSLFLCGLILTALGVTLLRH